MSFAFVQVLLLFSSLQSDLHHYNGKRHGKPFIRDRSKSKVFGFGLRSTTQDKSQKNWPWLIRYGTNNAKGLNSSDGKRHLRNDGGPTKHNGMQAEQHWCGHNTGRQYSFKSFEIHVAENVKHITLVSCLQRKRSCSIYTLNWTQSKVLHLLNATLHHACTSTPFFKWLYTQTIWQQVYC